MTYRDKHEILKQMLQTIQTPKTKTDIFYECKLSYTQLVTYMKYMAEHELYDYNFVKKTFMISESGRKLLKRLELMPDI